MEWIYPVLRTWLHLLFGVSVLAVVYAVLFILLDLLGYEHDDHDEKLQKYR